MTGGRQPWFRSPFREKLRERGHDVLRADLLARSRRTWTVDLHDVAVEESRERAGQLRITRGFKDAPRGRREVTT